MTGVDFGEDAYAMMTAVVHHSVVFVAEDKEKSGTGRETCARYCKEYSLQGGKSLHPCLEKVCKAGIQGPWSEIPSCASLFPILQHIIASALP